MTEYELYIKYIKDFHDKAASIVEAKSKDYAGVDQPMRNFYDASSSAGVTVEQGILVRMADKISRIRSLTERMSSAGNVGEKLEDTLMDLSNYATILAYYVSENYNSDIVNQLRLPEEPLEEIKDTRTLDQQYEDMQALGMNIKNPSEPLDNRGWFEKYMGIN